MYGPTCRQHFSWTKNHMPKTKSIDITFQQGPPISSCNLTICSVGLNYFWGCTFRTLEESFYCVKYGLSIITLKIPSKILSNENKKTGVSRKLIVLAF